MQIKEITTFFANSTAIIVDMPVLTICATHGLVVPLSNIWTVNIHLLFYTAPFLYLFDRFCSKSCRAHSHNNVIVFSSHQFHLLITVSAPLNSCTNIPSFAAFLHLFDRNQSGLSFFLWRGAFYQIVSYIRIVQPVQFPLG